MKTLILIFLAFVASAYGANPTPTPTPVTTKTIYVPIKATVSSYGKQAIALFMLDGVPYFITMTFAIAAGTPPSLPIPTPAPSVTATPTATPIATPTATPK